MIILKSLPALNIMTQEKQEKQKLSGKTQEKHRHIYEKQIGNKGNIPITFENARKRVYELVKQGQNYRDITQIVFTILGRESPKKFSIAEISRIKKYYDVQEDTCEPKKVSDLIDSEKALIFELLEKNYSPTGIVIFTKYSPEFVKNTVSEYLEMKHCSPRLFKELVLLSKEYGYKIQNSKQIEILFRNALTRYVFWNKLHYNCSVCKKPVYFLPDKNSDWLEDLGDGLSYLSQNNWHPECD